MTAAAPRASSQRVPLLIALGVLAILLAAGAAYASFTPTPPWLGWVLGITATLLAATTLVTILMPTRGGTTRPLTSLDHEEPPVLEEAVITLRCASCGSAFEIAEPHVRPFQHACPHCGAAGHLPAPTTLEPIARRTIESLCAKCGARAIVPDTGVRPLRHACPRCGEVGLWEGSRPRDVDR